MTGPETWTTDRPALERMVEKLNADDKDCRYEIETRGRYFAIAVYDRADNTKLGNL